VGKKLADFNPAIDNCPVIAGINEEVREFVSGFPFPGIDPTTQRQ